MGKGGLLKPTKKYTKKNHGYNKGNITQIEGNKKYLGLKRCSILKNLQACHSLPQRSLVFWDVHGPLVKVPYFPYFVLSFMLSFDVIIFHGKQMLKFLCYHFPLYIFSVIIYVII
jgi:hypothetical protein